MKRGFLNYVVIAVAVAVIFLVVCYVIDLIFGETASQTLQVRIGESLTFGVAMSIYYFIEDRFFKKK